MGIGPNRPTAERQVTARTATPTPEMASPRTSSTRETGSATTSSVDGRSADSTSLTAATQTTATAMGRTCQGTIGGSTYGVAKKVDLVAVRVFPCNGGAAYSTIIAAMDWVVGEPDGYVGAQHEPGRWSLPNRSMTRSRTPRARPA